ncbi:MAG: OmpA family protein, partial [Bacteroidota bacterium]
TAISVEVLVFDERSTQPLPGATVVIACKKDTLTTDAEGKVRFDMKLNDCCDLSASLEEYEPNKVEGCTKDLTLQDKLTVKIPLRQVAEFIVEGVVFDVSTTLPMEAATVTLVNTCGKPIAEPYTTTVNGYYKFKLDRDCCYKIKAEVDGYFAGIADTCTTGLDTSMAFKINLYLKPTSISVIPGGKNPDDEVVVTETETPHTYYDKELDLWIDKDTRLPAEGTYPDGNVYEKGVWMKRPDFPQGPVPPTVANPEIPYLVHIYYDYDQAYIRDDAVPELEKLYTLLAENPKYIIEIGSHTDARASDGYNNRLSQRRAEAVVRWLTDKGIDRTRLVAKGYGETVNVNDCTNNIPCSEKQHQMNRRTEFKVVGCRNCKNKKVLAASNANENTKVDECKTCPF